MTNLLAIDPKFDLGRRRCRAVVETPQGSRSKFDYDAGTGMFELAAVLPAGMAFPMAFGFVPSTRGEDGDPLDILILSDEPLPAAVLVPVQLLGVIEASQTAKGKTVRNDRLLAKVAASHLWADVDDADQLGDAFARDLEKFFETYNELRGRRFKLRKVAGPKQACLLIQEAMLE